MKNIKELRVGNFVVANNKGWAVGAIDWFKNEVVLYNIGMPAIKDTFKVDELKPIPISKEWLKLFSVKDYFEERSYDYYYDFQGESICTVDSNGQSNDVINCKYIHDLQNAWFMLNKQELELKD